MEHTCENPGEFHVHSQSYVASKLCRAWYTISGEITERACIRYTHDQRVQSPYNQDDVSIYEVRGEGGGEEKKKKKKTEEGRKKTRGNDDQGKDDTLTTMITIMLL